MASERGVDEPPAAAGAAPLPPSVLDFSELEQSIHSFTRRFDEYVQTTVAACDRARREADEQHAADHTRLRALERERDEAKQSQKALWESVASERDADAKLRASVQSLQAQRTALLQRTASLRTEMQEMQAQVQARREAKHAQVQRLRDQVQRNAPELAELEQLTGCTLAPSRAAGSIDIGFSLVSAEDPTRTFVLTLDVAHTQYQVPSHDPALPAATVKALTRQLNHTGDVHAFLKDVRRALVASMPKDP